MLEDLIPAFHDLSGLSRLSLNVQWSDTVLLTNLYKRLTQPINPSHCPESTFPDNTVIWSCSSGRVNWLQSPTLLMQQAEVVQGHFSASTKSLLLNLRWCTNSSRFISVILNALTNIYILITRYRLFNVPSDCLFT